ncbi:MAG: FHA domain-containing protein [Gemmatimonadaceae bacterium]|nr:FHA domain-containing protein [Gemmatimonadaceae bacterium]
MTFVLVSTSGDRRFLIEDGVVLVAGRDISCELPILDAGVSRRQAELRADESGITIVDLDSRNGTWINGTRVKTGRAVPGDAVAFGTVVFTVLERTDADRRPAITGSTLDGSATVVLERAVPSRDTAVAEVAGQRLAKLVTLAQRLGGLTSVEQLLPIIVDDLFGAFDADRVAVLLQGPTGEMELRVVRDAPGGDVERSVPRAIVNGVSERQVALLTHDALEDTRTAGDSVVRQAVRSAMAAPLLGDGQMTLGVAYVDNVRSARAFSEDDLHFLVAFAGIAAAAVEREATASRLRHAAHVRENFERYFSPQLAERIAATSGSMAPGGHRQPVVVLFSDIRGFTAIAESLPPVAMAAQLNEYFGAMVDCVFERDGALDKFIGDALLAYWGAPEPRDDDAMRAVHAARAMQEGLRSLNARWRSEGRPELQAGIAVHCGEAFVGNIGSPRRLEYTIIGDTVNLANKLCARARGSEILITDAMRVALVDGATLVAREDIVLERRADNAMAVWEVLP